MLTSLIRKPKPILDTVAIVPEDVPPPLEAPAPDKRPIDQLDLSTRTRNILHKAGIDLIEQLKELDDLTTIPGLGAKSVEEVNEAIAKFQMPPDQLALSFKGMMLVIGAAGVESLIAPDGWRVIDVFGMFGPVINGLELARRLKHFAQYPRLMVHLGPIDDAEVRANILAFASHNKVPVVCC